MMKGRPKKYTDKEMNQFLELYIKEFGGHKKLVASEIAHYINEKYLASGDPIDGQNRGLLTYQDFSEKRHKAVADQIKLFNERLTLASCAVPDESTTSDILIDIEQFLQMRHSESKLRSALTRENQLIAQVLDANRHMVTHSHEQQAEIAHLQSEIEVLRRRLATEEKQFRTKLEQKASCLADSQTRIKKAKALCKAYRAYFYTYLYTPAMQATFVNLGLLQINPDEIHLSDEAKKMVTPCQTVLTAIESYMHKMAEACPPEAEPEQSLEQDTEALEEQDDDDFSEQKIDVMSQAETENWKALQDL